MPRAYLAASAELAYAGNVHVAQGRTVDTAHLLATETLSRQALYVGMTRGRQSNTAHVITGTTAPPGHKPYQQATAESVLADIMGRDDGDLSANRADPPDPELGRRNRSPPHPVDRRHPADPPPRHRPADHRPAHRNRSLAIPARALPQGPPPAAPRRPALRTRHHRNHRPDHCRADGRRPVHRQRPARPPAAPAPVWAGRARPDLGPAHTHDGRRSSTPSLARSERKVAGSGISAL